MEVLAALGACSNDYGANLAQIGSSFVITSTCLFFTLKRLFPWPF
jgi:hypothetical protein